MGLKKMHYWYLMASLSKITCNRWGMPGHPRRPLFVLKITCVTGQRQHRSRLSSWPHSPEEFSRWLVARIFIFFFAGPQSKSQMSFKQLLKVSDCILITDNIWNWNGNPEKDEKLRKYLWNSCSWTVSSWQEELVSAQFPSSRYNTILQLFIKNYLKNIGNLSSNFTSFAKKRRLWQYQKFCN